MTCVMRVEVERRGEEEKEVKRIGWCVSAGDEGVGGCGEHVPEGALAAAGAHL